MHELKHDFASRCLEIKNYLNFVSSIEAGEIYNKNGKSLDNQIIKVLKANMFLLLYNLVESTVDRAIDCLLIQICNNNIKYESIVDELQLQWSKVHVRQNLQSQNSKTIEANLKTILNKTLNEYVKFEGDYKPKIRDNIDSEEIRTIAKSFGFKWKPSKDLKGGVFLDTIKQHRNNLAHGSVSFSACGRDYETGQLEDLSKKTTKLLEEFIRTIENYIDNQAYKKD